MIKFSAAFPESLTGGGVLALIQDSKPEILLEGGKAVQNLIRNWFQSKYPGSSHWNPSRVLDPVVSQDSVEVPIAVPGVSRAYHDLVIRPSNAQSLAIPVHPSARGTSPRDWSNLFRPRGKDWLGRNENGNLIVMFALKSQVVQRQDRSLLPPDDEMVNTAVAAMRAAASRIIDGSH